jgi:hypothetical protein
VLLDLAPEHLGWEGGGIGTGSLKPVVAVTYDNASSPLDGPEIAIVKRACLAGEQGNRPTRRRSGGGWQLDKELSTLNKSEEVKGTPGPLNVLQAQAVLVSCGKLSGRFTLHPGTLCRLRLGCCAGTQGLVAISPSGPPSPQLQSSHAFLILHLRECYCQTAPMAARSEKLFFERFLLALVCSHRPEPNLLAWLQFSRPLAADRCTACWARSSPAAGDIFNFVIDCWRVTADQVSGAPHDTRLLHDVLHAVKYRVRDI